MQLPTGFARRGNEWPIRPFDWRDESMLNLSKQYDYTSNSRIRCGRCSPRCLGHWASCIAKRRRFEKGNWRFAVLLNRRPYNFIRQDAGDRMASCDNDV